MSQGWQIVHVYPEGWTAYLEMFASIGASLNSPDAQVALCLGSCSGELSVMETPCPASLWQLPFLIVDFLSFIKRHKNKQESPSSGTDPALLQ